MTSPISSGLLTQVSRTVNRMLTSTAHVRRTNTTVACLVIADTASTTMREMPPYMHLRTWQIILPTDTDAAEWDILTVSGTGAGTYLIADVSSAETYNVAVIVGAIRLGAAVSAHTLREPDPLLPGQVAAFSTYLTGLQLRPLLGTLIQPISPQAAFDALGIQLQQPAMVLAEWPVGYTGTNPVQPQDVLVLDTDGTEYQVSGVRPYQGKMLEIYIDRTEEFTT